MKNIINFLLVLITISVCACSPQNSPDQGGDSSTNGSPSTNINDYVGIWKSSGETFPFYPKMVKLNADGTAMFDTGAIMNAGNKYMDENNYVKTTWHLEEVEFVESTELCLYLEYVSAEKDDDSYGHGEEIRRVFVKKIEKDKITYGVEYSDKLYCWVRASEAELEEFIKTLRVR